MDGRHAFTTRGRTGAKHDSVRCARELPKAQCNGRMVSPGAGVLTHAAP